MRLRIPPYHIQDSWRLVFSNCFSFLLLGAIFFLVFFLTITIELHIYKDLSSCMSQIPYFNFANRWNSLINVTFISMFMLLVDRRFHGFSFAVSVDLMCYLLQAWSSHEEARPALYPWWYIRGGVQSNLFVNRASVTNNTYLSVLTVRYLN